MGRWTRRLAWGSAFFASLVLYANLLAWALYAPAMSVGIETPICVADGPAASSTLDPVSDKSPGHADLGGRHCPLGWLAGSVAAPPAFAALPVPSPLAAERLALPTRLGPLAAGFTAWNARAPPHSA